MGKTKRRDTSETKPPDSLIDQVRTVAEGAYKDLQKRLPADLGRQVEKTVGQGQKTVQTGLKVIRAQLKNTAKRSDVDKLTRRLDVLAKDVERLVTSVAKAAGARPPSRPAAKPAALSAAKPAAKKAPTARAIANRSAAKAKPAARSAAKPAARASESGASTKATSKTATPKPEAKKARATRANAPRASTSRAPASRGGQPPVSGAQPVVAVGTGDDAKSAG